MKKILSIYMFLSGLVAFAEPARTFAKDFFAAHDEIERGAIDSVARAHPDWDRKIALYQEFARADSATFRYLFVYHAEHKDAPLEWSDGNGKFGIFLCNCGQEGSVPTKEFEALFRKRSAAMARFYDAFGGDAFSEVYQAVKSAANWGAVESIKSLRARFEPFAKAPDPAQDDSPPPTPPKSS